MARRKQSSRNSSSHYNDRRSTKESPGWVWATAGLAVGLLVALLVWLSFVEPPSKRISENKPNKAASITPEKRIAQKQPTKPKPAVVNVPANAKKITTKKSVPEYEFYKILPEQTVEVPTSDYKKESVRQTPLQQEIKEPKVGRSTYILQAGSFRKPKDASRRRGQLALLGVESRAEKVNVNDGIWHRVRVGPYKNLDEVNRIRTMLHSEKIQTMLITSGK